MKHRTINSFALIISAAALFAGCGGSQRPIGAPGTTPQSRAIVQHAARSKSWMQETSGDLTYASGPDTYILSYPTGGIVNSFSVREALSLCSNKKGEVFFPGSEQVLKYEHGATSPSATLKDAGYFAAACSSDPQSGDLAVANSTGAVSGPGSLAIYTKGKGKPNFYFDPTIKYYDSCAYDNRGNLFVIGGSASAGVVLTEKSRGSDTFTDISVSASVPNPGQLQWDGKYLALAADGNRTIYRLAISGSTATVAGTTTLSGQRKGLTFVINANRILAPSGKYGTQVGVWRYPQGGQRLTVSQTLYSKHALITGVTVSLAPHR